MGNSTLDHDKETIPEVAEMLGELADRMAEIIRAREPVSISVDAHMACGQLRLAGKTEDAAGEIEIGFPQSLLDVVVGSFGEDGIDELREEGPEYCKAVCDACREVISTLGYCGAIPQNLSAPRFKVVGNKLKVFR